jgi:glycerophosphoryl diester phosphodiesterase
VYLTAASADLLRKARALDGNVSLCFCQTDDTPCDAVAVATELDCTRVQFSTNYATKERVEAAHAQNLKVGIYCTNTPEEAKTALAMGADTLLTDDYYQIARAVK